MLPYLANTLPQTGNVGRLTVLLVLLGTAVQFIIIDYFALSINDIYMKEYSTFFAPMIYLKKVAPAIEFCKKIRCNSIANGIMTTEAYMLISVCYVSLARRKTSDQ